MPGLYRALTQPPFPHGSPEGTNLSEMVPVATSFGVAAGVLTLGVATVRARGLGRCRVLPLVLGLLGAASLPYLYLERVSKPLSGPSGCGRRLGDFAPR